MAALEHDLADAMLHPARRTRRDDAHRWHALVATLPVWGAQASVERGEERVLRPWRDPFPQVSDD